MRSDDTGTDTDPDAPGMTFGRPPTRPGDPGDAVPDGPAATSSHDAVPDEVIDPPESESVTVDPPGAPSGPVAAIGPEAPPSPGGLGTEPALAADQVADLRRRWAAVQTAFVDDPRRAVEVADGILAEAVGAFQAAIDDRRRAMAEPWYDDADASTDALLDAFQGYRAVFDRVLSV